MRPFAVRALAVAAAVFAAPGASGSEQGLKAKLACGPVPAPGRVLCQVELEASPERVVWADALVVSSPDFAKPLRARVPASSDGAAGRRAVALAFMAEREGRGPVTVTARAVLCASASGADECRPELRRLQAELAVGSGL